MKLTYAIMSCLPALCCCYSVLAAPGDKKWDFVTGGSGSSSPAIGADGTVYIGSYDNKVYALHGATGGIKWQYATGSNVTSSPAIGADGTVYIGSRDRTIYALDGATGNKKWEFLTGGGVSSSPAIGGADGTVYIGSQDNKVYALDGTTGAKKWEFLTGAAVYSSPAIGARSEVYIGSYDKTLYALDGTTGAKKWEFLTGAAVTSSPAIGSDGTVYIGSQDNKLYALDGATGAKKWEFLTRAPFSSSPAIGSDGTVYIGSQDNKVYALDGAIGGKRWEFLTGAAVSSSPAIGADGTVYIGSNDGNVYALDGATGGKKWEFVLGSAVSSSPAIGTDGTVYFGAHTNVYALEGTSPLAASPWPMKGRNIRRDASSEIIGPPHIIAQPVGREAFLGGTTILAVSAVGTRPMSYRWQKDGVDLVNGGQLTGADEGHLRLGTLQPQDAGRYRAIVENAAGSAISLDAVLTLRSPLPGELRWVFTITNSSLGGDNIALSSPAVGSDGTVYVTSWQSHVYALDGATGVKRWVFGDGLSGYSAPVIGTDDTVYVGSTDRRVYALHGVTGVTKWECLLGDRDNSPYIAAIGIDGTLYVTSYGGAVYAMDGATGATKWEFKTGVDFEDTPLSLHSPVIGVDGTVYFGTMSGTFYALDGVTGAKRWDYRLGMDAEGRIIGITSSAAIGADGTLYFTAIAENSSDELLYAVNGATGAKKWVRSVLGGQSPLVGADGTVYVGSTGYGIASALNGATGNTTWVRTFEATIPPVLEVSVSFEAIADDGTVYVGLAGSIEGGSKFSALDSATGTIKWEVAAGCSPDTSPAIGSDGTVYIVSMDGSLRALVGTSPIPDSGWPMKQRNARRTSSSETVGPPRIILQPVGHDAVLWRSTSLAVLASGTRPVTYRWQKDGVDLMNGERAAGVNTETLRLTNLQPNDAGGYRVVVANGEGSALSEEARLTLRPVTPGKLRWLFAEARTPSSPAVGANGTVYVGSFSVDENRLYALAGDSGTKTWEVKIGRSGISSPAIGADGTVYVGSVSPDNRVYAFDGTTGAKKWEFKTDGDVRSSCAIGADGTVYVGSGDGWVYALNGANGAKLWEFGTGSGGYTAPAIATDGTVYIGSQDKKVYALHGATGAKKWEFLIGAFVTSSPAIGANGTVYFGSHDKKVYALDGATGAQKWEYATGSHVLSSLAIGADGTVYVGSWDGKLYALDGATGVRKWEYATGSAIDSSPAIGTDGTVYIGAWDKKLYALDGATGIKKWEYATGGAIHTSPAIGADGTLYFGSQDNKVYALDCPSQLADSPWPMSGNNLRRSGRALPAQPTIPRPPADAVVVMGADIVFQAVADGQGVLLYQWRFNGMPIFGANNSSLVLTEVTAAQAGSYDVVVSNDRGSAVSPAATLVLMSVNQPPSFAKGADQLVNEDAAPQTVAGWASDIRAGPSSESSQALMFLVTNDNNPLFAAQPAISAEGTLTYAPAASTHGTATVSVVLKDDGGTANSGEDTSGVQSFVIQVIRAEPLHIGGISMEQGRLQIRWEHDHTLQVATNLSGPWTDLPEAQSPFGVVIEGSNRFYRLRSSQ